MARFGGMTESRVATQDGLRMWVREYSGPERGLTPVVCLSGFTRSLEDFEDFAEREGCRRRIVCVDLPGRGKAERSPDWRRYDPRRLVDDVRHLLVATGVHRAAFVGTSLGGLLSAAMAVAAPTQVAGIVFNDIGPDVGNSGLEAILAAIARDHPQTDWPAAVAFLRERFPDLPAHTPEEWLRVARKTFTTGPDGKLHYGWDTAIVRPLLAAGPDPVELRRLFSSVRDRPCLVLRGERSHVLTEAGFAAMKAAFPSWTFATIPGVGHAPSLSEPKAVETVDDFFVRIEPADRQRH